MSRSTRFLRWTPRVLSIVSIGITAFLILLFLTWPFGGGARPSNPAIVLLGTIIVASVAAWGWPRMGGAVVVLGGRRVRMRREWPKASNARQAVGAHGL